MKLKTFTSPFKQATNALKKIGLEVFIVNRRIRRIMKGDICKNYLKPYVKVIKKHSEFEPKDLPSENIIWQYWDQGIEEAPDIIKACWKSVERCEPNRKRVIITADTVKDYVEIPQFILDLKQKGIMKLAHFSDILRSYLLIQHGGTWIDSTVYLTDSIPEYITNSDLFVFQNYTADDLDGLNMASYFIHSKPNQKILVDTMTVLNKYWKDNNFLVNYFTFLHAFTMVTQATEENRSLFDKIPFTSFIPVQRMQYELLDKFNEERWNELCESTPIHKLSFKHKALFGKKTVDLSGTLYEHIINSAK